MPTAAEKPKEIIMQSELELNVDYIESLRADYLRDPASVPVD